MTITTYDSNRSWSDVYIPMIKQILGPLLLTTSSIYTDNNHAADLVLLNPDIHIACRIRRGGFVERYKNQFTLRYSYPSDTKTEFSKIMDGDGDWMFYGHTSGSALPVYWVIDLDVFRRQMREQHQLPKEQRTIDCGNRFNKDGTSFVWFDITSFSSSMVISSGSFGSYYPYTN